MQSLLRNRSTQARFALAFTVCLVGLMLCKQLQPYDGIGLLTYIRWAILAVACIAVFLRPLWGVVVVTASLPVGQLFPDIPFATSVFPMFGAMLLAGYLRAVLRGNLPRPAVTMTHACALLFILWIVASNPAAAVNMGDRVWIWTFIQLFVLMFVATQLLRNDADHRVVMRAFVVASVLSALVAIQQVQFGPTSADSVRASGLSYGANEGGKWFVMAIVFLVHLRRLIVHKWMKLVPLAAIAVLMAGLAATVSRTSFLLLFIGFAIMAIERNSLFRERLFEFSAALIAAGLFLIPAEYWHIISGILSSIIQGSDSAGFRYMQWDAGFAMWGDHPVAGVGIGRFEAHTAYYGYNFIPFYGLRWSAHNTYVTLLAETGLVGFVLFMGMVAAGIAGLVKGSFADWKEKPSSPHYTWLAAILVLLVGGLTGDDHVHKFIWMILGIAGIRFGSISFLHGKKNPA